MISLFGIPFCFLLRYLLDLIKFSFFSSSSFTRLYKNFESKYCSQRERWFNDVHLNIGWFLCRCPHFLRTIRLIFFISFPRVVNFTIFAILAASEGSVTFVSFDDFWSFDVMRDLSSFLSLLQVNEVLSFDDKYSPFTFSFAPGDNFARTQ